MADKGDKGKAGKKGKGEDLGGKDVQAEGGQESKVDEMKDFKQDFKQDDKDAGAKAGMGMGNPWDVKDDTDKRGSEKKDQDRPENKDIRRDDDRDRRAREGDRDFKDRDQQDREKRIQREFDREFDLYYGLRDPYGPIIDPYLNYIDHPMGAMGGYNYYDLHRNMGIKRDQDRPFNVERQYDMDREREYQKKQRDERDVRDQRPREREGRQGDQEDRERRLNRDQDIRMKGDRDRPRERDEDIRMKGDRDRQREMADRERRGQNGNQAGRSRADVYDRDFGEFDIERNEREGGARAHGSNRDFDKFKDFLLEGVIIQKEIYDGGMMKHKPISPLHYNIPQSMIPGPYNLPERMPEYHHLPAASPGQLNVGDRQPQQQVPQAHQQQRMRQREQMGQQQQINPQQYLQLLAQFIPHAYKQQMMPNQVYNMNQQQTSQMDQQIPQMGQQTSQMGQQIPQMGQQIPQIGQHIPQMGQQIPQMGQQFGQMSQQQAQMGQQIHISPQILKAIIYHLQKIPQLSQQQAHISPQILQAVINQLQRVPQVNQQQQVAQINPQLLQAIINQLLLQQMQMNSQGLQMNPQFMNQQFQQIPQNQQFMNQSQFQQMPQGQFVPYQQFQPSQTSLHQGMPIKPEDLPNWMMAALGNPNLDQRQAQLLLHQGRQPILVPAPQAFNFVQRGMQQQPYARN
jgi:hypothetical protein